MLDLGCNTGYGTATLATRAASCVGVDVNETALATARQRYPSIRFEQVGPGQLPFEDGAFDAVTFFQVLEHVEDVAPFLSEVRRVLAPGGNALLTTPNRRIRVDARDRPWNRFHVREYTDESLRDELGPFFDHVAVYGLRGPWPLELAERRRVGTLRVHRRAESFGSVARGASQFVRRVARRLPEDPVLLRLLARTEVDALAWHGSAGATKWGLDMMAICR